MLVAIPNLLTPQQVAYARQKLDAANWTDGAATAGVMAKKVKRNRQIDQNDRVGGEIGQMILKALSSNVTFLSAAQPLKVLPPKFNRYEGGEHYGAHIDNAIMDIPGSGGCACARTSVLDTYGHKAIKLPAGHAILYTATSLHEVTPVTRGIRTSSFFWIQSLIRDDARRSMLYDLSEVIGSLTATHPDHPSLSGFVGHYHKLLQHWIEL